VLGASHSQIARTILVLIAACLFTFPAQARYSGGSGTAQDPYQIATAADLIALGETPEDYDKHFLLTADIDLDPNLPGRKVFDKAVFAPDVNDAADGFQGTSFTGVFDGEGHVISHLTIIGKDYVGLMGVLQGRAEVKNLGVADVNVAGSGRAVGGLVGMSGTGKVGYGSLMECYSTGSVRGCSQVGGLVGCSSGPVTHCYSAAAVSGTDIVGGLVGGNYKDYQIGVLQGAVTRCYSTGRVTGTDHVGGLVGDGNGETVTACLWDTQTSGQPTSVGGTRKTTAEMQDIRTYQVIGWDFAGEIVDGLHEIWWMPQTAGYPTLAVLSGHPPRQLLGRGTPDDPYRISDRFDLGAMLRHSASAHYRLVASIDLAGVRWSMAIVSSFAGTFDGDGHTISYLTIKGDEPALGLFGVLASGAEVKGLGVVDVNVCGGRDSHCVGGLVGWNSGTVAQCYTTGAVSSNYEVGGLVGANYIGTLTQCYSAAVVHGVTYSGGLVGYHCQGAVTQCYSTGAVSGEETVGGLVGFSLGDVMDCYSTGAVAGKGKYVGGLIGDNHDAVIQCFWDTQTSGQAKSDGGTGKTTAEMQTASTFLDAGWDFVSETANGTADLWWILEGKDYPRLWWEWIPAN